MIEDKWKCLMTLMKIGVDTANLKNIMNPFKPNSSRVDKLENQIINLRERVATLEKDLHFFMRHYEKSND